jgi:phage tail-like protein
VSDPIHVFRFHVDFHEAPLGGSGGGDHPLCGGAFAECSGFEATMEPVAIKEGGSNFGAAQRAGPVTFATVVLKRGMTPARDLWQWFELVNAHRSYAHRLAATVNVYDAAGKAVVAWRLERALPVKFRAADLNASGSDVAIEELHLVHEGLSLVDPTRPSVS